MQPCNRSSPHPIKLVQVTDELFDTLDAEEEFRLTTESLTLSDQASDALVMAETLRLSTEELTDALAEKEMLAKKEKGIRRDLAATGVLVLITILWGVSVLPLDFAVLHTGVFTFQTIRFSLAALTLGLLFHRRLANLTRREVFAGILTGCILFCFFATQTIALLYTTISMEGFLGGLYVPVVPLLSILILRQWPSWKAWIGIVISFCGLMLLSINGSFVFTFGVGELLLLISSVCYALYIVLLDRYAPKVSTVNLSTIQMVVMALLSLISIPIAREPLVMPPGSVWLAALFMALIPSALCMALMIKVQQFVSGVRATLCYALEPVWVGVCGYFVGDRLGIQALIGCACILASVVFVGLLSLKQNISSSS